MRKHERLVYVGAIVLLVTLQVVPLVFAQNSGGGWIIAEQSDGRIVLERESADAETLGSQEHETPDSMRFWHAPGAHDDVPDHEHGDSVPQWVIDAGYAPEFHHAGMTPGENHSYWKHSGFKAFADTFGAVDIYYIGHFDTNPGGHAPRFHSYQLWMQDSQEGVSHLHGWIDFGEHDMTGPRLSLVGCDNLAPAPIVAINDRDCDTALHFESWYSRPGGSGDWSIDIGFQSSANFYHGGDITDPTTWDPTEGNNLTRRLEIGWYSGRSDIRGEFWATQFGEIVSGPDDATCSETRSYGDRTYDVVCLRQYIAPTAEEIGFPSNSAQQTYPDGAGITNPN